MTSGTAIPVELEQLLAHAEWADARVWESCLATPGAQDDARLRELLHHVHTVQWVYLQLLRGDTVEIGEAGDFEDLASIRDWGRAAHEGIADLASTLGPDDLGRPVDVPWAQQLVARYGEARLADVRQALLQVASHSTYHRGQINTRIREVGGEPPLCDFVVWVWAGRPAAGWPDG